MTDSIKGNVCALTFGDGKSYEGIGTLVVFERYAVWKTSRLPVGNCTGAARA
ncbi:MAG TPA: hypothetical protein V6D17_25170 [Candidatus Obscuribacterales bacterium]